MRLFTKFHQRLRVTFIKIAFLVIFANVLLLPHYIKIDVAGDNTYMVVINGVECGTVSDTDLVDEYIRDARRKIACLNDGLVLIEADVELKGSHRLFGMLSKPSEVKSNITRVLENNIKETMQHAYVVKVKETTLSLSSTSEVEALFNSAIDKYDVNNEYTVKLDFAPDRELSVLATSINNTSDEAIAADTTASVKNTKEAGVQAELTTIVEDSDTQGEKEFSDYEYGILDMAFSDDVEVVEAYIPQSQITDLDTAINVLIEEQEQQQIYTVKSGDTLSGISIDVDIPMDDIIAMNSSLVNERSTIYIGQELIISVPVPELSVVWQEEAYYEESYEADIIYVDNDSWYTTDKVTLQEPVEGYRKVVAIRTYNNDDITDVNIIKEEIVVEAVPKIVERGTIIPPTYIKPISGGRITSYFGKRNTGIKGASTNHKGIDWGTPIGTTVRASCAGKVTKAGWVSGYGYVVYIDHENGRQTRYGHLSKITVKEGQYVSQGDKIALSGNTGITSGPHIHFEIRIYGVAVDPLKYLE